MDKENGRVKRRDGKRERRERERIG